MRVVNVMLPVLFTALSIGVGNAAWAGPASALDPYSYIQAPTKEEREAMLAKKNKKRKKEESASTDTAQMHSAAQNQQNGIAGPFDVVLDGVKQSTAGIGKGAKAAGGKIASGTAGMFRGTANLGSKLTGGLGGSKKKSEPEHKVASSSTKSAHSGVTGSAPAKTAETAEKASADDKKGGSVVGGIGDKLSDMNKAVAGGFKSAGGAMKNGTVSVAKGFKSAGGKLVDGTQAAGAKMASLPKAIGIGGKSKSSAVASKSAPSAPAVANSSTPAPEATASNATSDGALRPAVPVTASTPAVKVDGGGPMSGISGAAKKLATAPKAGLSVIGQGFSKLNPFGGKDKQAPAPAATAAKSGAVPQ